MKINISQILAALLSVLLINACSGPALDEKSGLLEKHLAEDIDRNSEGTIKLISLEGAEGHISSVDKLNGVEVKKAYSMPFKAVVEVQQDCYKIYFGAGNEWLFSTFQTFLKKGEHRMANMMGMEEVKLTKGERFELMGTSTLRDEGSGWEVDRYKVEEANKL